LGELGVIYTVHLWLVGNALWWVTLSANFRENGPSTNFCVRKLDSLGYNAVLFA